MSFDELLTEAASFKTRLTADTQLIMLEQLLHSSMAPFSVDNPDILDSRCKGIGIYYIEVKFPFTTYEELENFGERWGRIRAGGVPSAMPRYYPERAKMHRKRISDREFIPFYLGKRLDIKDRLTGHILGKRDSKTYSLKLQSRPEVIKDVIFRFGFLPIPVHEDGFFCVALIEHALRDRIHPIIGKQ
jgi:hypothetical protein